MNWLQEFLRRQREADLYSEMPIDAYQGYSPVRSLGNVGPRPKIKSVVTETEGQPRKVTTTFDFPDTRELGLLSNSMLEMDRRGGDPYVADKVPFSFGAIRDFGIGPNPHLDPTMDQIVTANSKFLADSGVFNNAMPGGGVAGILGGSSRAAARAAKPKVTPEQAKQAAAERARLKSVGGLGESTAITTPVAIGAASTLPLIPVGSDNNLSDPYRVEAYEPPAVVGDSVVLSDKGRIFADSPGDEGYIPDAQEQVGRSPYYTERAGERLAFLESQNAPQITQVRPEAIQVEENPILKSMYGRFARDPESRKQQYLDQLNKIYKNAMILNAVANLTGGQSQAGAYLRMATSKMDAIDKFDQEQRLQDIWKAIYFDQNGEYRAPGSWDKAFEMATVLGASPQEASEIATVAYKKPDRDEEKKSAYEKLLDNAVASGLITQAEKSTAMRNKLGLKEDTQTLTALEKNIKSALESGAITQEQANEARRFALLGGKPGSDNEYAARSAMMRLYQARYTTQFGGLKSGAPSFEKFLQDNMADYNALLYGIAAGAISPTSSNSEMITNVQRVN